MKRNLIILTLVVFACSSSFLLSERQVVAEEVITAPPEEEVETVEEKTPPVKEEGVETFHGLKFGVGVALTVGIGEKPCVESASIVEGYVRVDKERDATATVMLESHYFFEMPPIGKNKKEWGLGPFVAIQPGGSDEIIEAFGIGAMIGFRREPKGTSSWNFGVAYIVDPSVKVLGDGFEENEPPPANETEVRFKEVADTGILVIVSFSF